MTIIDDLADALVAQLGPTGLQANIRSSHDKHPNQNAQLQSLNSSMSSKGIITRFRSQSQDIDNRGILITLDGDSIIKRDGIFDIILNSTVINRFVTLNSLFNKEWFETDFVLEHEETVENSTVQFTIQIWRRVKVRI